MSIGGDSDGGFLRQRLCLPRCPATRLRMLSLLWLLLWPLLLQLECPLLLERLVARYVLPEAPQVEKLRRLLALAAWREEVEGETKQKKRTR
jgi:hypothetical protein